jgi:hypothetical protein
MASPGRAQEEARIRGEAMLRSLAHAGAHFEVNRGQLGEQVDFAFRASDYLLELSDHGIGIGLPGTQLVLGPPMRIAFLNVPGTSTAHGRDELPFGVMQRVTRDGVRRHLTRIPTFRSVEYKDMYTGIDVQYYVSSGKLEYDFVVAPHADPGQIALGLEGARAAELDAEGNLRLQFPVAELVQHKPRAYQVIEGRRVEVDGHYKLQDERRVAIEVGAYDANLPLVIDPMISLKVNGSTYGKLHN